MRLLKLERFTVLTLEPDVSVVQSVIFDQRLGKANTVTLINRLTEVQTSTLFALLLKF